MIEGFADITAGHINHYFAEIVPRTVYPLYGTVNHSYCSISYAVHLTFYGTYNTSLVFNHPPIHSIINTAIKLLSVYNDIMRKSCQ